MLEHPEKFRKASSDKSESASGEGSLVGRSGTGDESPSGGVEAEECPVEDGVSYSRDIDGLLDILCSLG